MAIQVTSYLDSAGVRYPTAAAADASDTLREVCRTVCDIAGYDDGDRYETTGYPAKDYALFLLRSEIRDLKESIDGAIAEYTPAKWRALTGATVEDCKGEPR